MPKLFLDIGTSGIRVKIQFGPEMEDFRAINLSPEELERFVFKAQALLQDMKENPEAYEN